MIDERTITRFLSDINRHIDGETYDGIDGEHCLVGQLFDYVAPSQLPDPDGLGLVHPRVDTVASYYGLPRACVDAIYCTASRAPFRLNLDAAIWMAEYYLRNWSRDLADEYLDHQLSVERRVAGKRNEFVLLSGGLA